MLKINRKPNGEVLGLSIFLGVDVIGKFVSSGATHLEVKKTHTANGVLLEFEPIKDEIDKDQSAMVLACPKLVDSEFSGHDFLKSCT